MLLVKVLFIIRACNVWYSPKNEEITLPHSFIIEFILILSILISSMICIVSYSYSYNYSSTLDPSYCFQRQTKTMWILVFNYSILKWCWGKSWSMVYVCRRLFGWCNHCLTIDKGCLLKRSAAQGKHSMRLHTFPYAKTIEMRVIQN